MIIYLLRVLVAAVKARRKAATTTPAAASAAAARQHTEEEDQLAQLQGSLLEALQAHCCLPAGQLVQPLAGGPDGRLQLFLSTAASLEVSLQHVVEFAKRLPGFLSLPTSLQLILLKANSLQMVLIFDLLLNASSSSPISDLSPSPLVTFLDGKYLSALQTEALFSRDFVERYRRLKEHCALQAHRLGGPLIVALLAAGLLLSLPSNAADNDHETAAAASMQILTARVAAATTAVISAADLTAVRWEVVRGVGEAAREMLDFFKIFQSFCDTRHLPPVFGEVFDF